MIIRCESCGLAYALDDSRVRPQGTKVRCSKCKHVFTVFPVEDARTGEDFFPTTQKDYEGPTLREWEDEFTVKPAAPTQKKVVPPAPREKPPRPKTLPSDKPEKPLIEDDTFEETPLFTERIPRPRTTAPEPRYRRERRVSRVLIFSLLLVVLAVGVFYYLTRTDTSIPIFSTIYQTVSDLMGGKKGHEVSVVFLRGSELQVEGKKVFVIQGSVVNKSKAEKIYVKLKGFLYNKEGKTIATSVGYCGYTRSTDEIKNSSYEALRKAFTFIPPAKAPSVPPDKTLAFTLLFFGPLEGAMEYSVEIFDAPTRT